VKFKEERFDSFVDKWFGVDCDGLFRGHDVNHWMAKLRSGAIISVTCCDEQVPVSIRDAIARFTIVEVAKSNGPWMSWSSCKRYIHSRKGTKLRVRAMSGENDVGGIR
jgi:hypothetical protein